MKSFSAIELYAEPSGAVIHVQGQTQYRVVISDEEARVTAPGLSVLVELDPEIHPCDDSEALACMLVAQLEGGIEL